MGVFTDLGEVLDSPAICLEVLGTGVTKEPCGTGSFICAEACTFNLSSQVAVRLDRTWPIRKVSTLEIPSKKSRTRECYCTCQGPRCHPFKPQSHDALGSTVFHKVVGLVERRGTR